MISWNRHDFGHACSVFISGVHGDEAYKVILNVNLLLALAAGLIGCFYINCIHIYEALPSAEYSKENQMWWSLSDDEKLPFLRSKVKQDYEAFRSSVWLLANSGCLSDEQSVAVINKVFELEKTAYDGKTTPDGWGAAKLQSDIAKLYARLHNSSEALEHLKLGAIAAKAFDNRPETQSYSSILLGCFERKRSDFETADTRSLAEIMRGKWLESEEFDGLRDDAEFKSIIDRLS